MSGKMPEYKVQEAKKSRYIIVHYGIFKIGWDWLILLCTFYIAIMVPFNAAFQRMNEARGSIYSDVFVEILFIVGKNLFLVKCKHELHAWWNIQKIHSGMAPVICGQGCLEGGCPPVCWQHIKTNLQCLDIIICILLYMSQNIGG